MSEKRSDRQDGIQDHHPPPEGDDDGGGYRTPITATGSTVDEDDTSRERSALRSDVVRDLFADAPRWPLGVSFLGPSEAFPELTVMTMRELQILHSRLSRQREFEYLTDEGPHPVTLDRHADVSRALDDRDGPAPAPAPAPAAAPAS